MKFLHKRNVFPSDVVGIYHPAFFPIHCSRKSGADPDTIIHFQVVLFQHFRNGRPDLPDRKPVIFLRPDLHFPFFKANMIHIYQPGLNLSARHIHRDSYGVCLFPDRGYQRFAFPFHLKFPGTRRQKKAVSLFKVYRFAAADNRSIPLHDQKMSERILRHHASRLSQHPSVQIQLIDGKIIAFYQMRGYRFISYQRNTVRHGKRLFNMQIPLSALSVHAPVIVYPVGYIGVLLDFRNDNVLSDRMDRSRFDQKHIALLHRNFI